MIDNNSAIATDTVYNQGIPLGGFVVYLAGTDFYDITDQDEVSPGVTGNKGIYKVYNNAQKNDLESAMAASPIYQRFEIKNVPPGRYVMRVASHRVTEEDLLDRGYQNTSTTVSYDPRVSLVWGTEKIVDVTTSDVIYDPAVEGFSVIDLPRTNGNTTANVGYLTENLKEDGIFPPLEEPIELARISFYSSSPAISNEFYRSGPYSGPYEETPSPNVQYAYTDHNGFYFATCGEVNSLYSDKIGSLGNLLAIDSYVYKAFTSLTPIFTATYLKGSNPNLDISSKVKIKGFVRSNAGFGAQGVVIVPRFARPTKTDANGNYSKNLYGDTYLYDTTSLPRRDPSVLTIGYPLWAEFSVDNSAYPLIGVGTNTGYFNVSNPFELYDNEITSSEVGGGSGFKRGYDGRFGIIYRDNGSRVSQVFTNESLQTHVNFYTERNQYGVQENYGKPSLEWSIAHKAPEWATNYQWVRTKNESALDFFQFAINEVAFSDENGDPVLSFASAVKVDMGLDNVSEYGDQNPGSTVAIPASIDLSWRVRFINNAAGTYYDFFDEALVSTSGLVATGIAIAKNSEFEPQPGTLIEIYRPQRLSDTKLYYEFGQCYEVINGFHQGPSKNQSEWEFTDNQWDTGNLSFIGNQDHDFVVGQVVDVYQSYPYTNGSYNGKATITEVPTSKLNSLR